MSKELSFEEAIVKLEQIVEDLEEGKLPLDETLERFKEGRKLSEICGKMLNEAELQIKELVETAGEAELKEYRLEG